MRSDGPISDKLNIELNELLNKVTILEQNIPGTKVQSKVDTDNVENITEKLQSSQPFEKDCQIDKHSSVICDDRNEKSTNTEIDGQCDDNSGACKSDMVSTTISGQCHTSAASSHDSSDEIVKQQLQGNKTEYEVLKQELVSLLHNNGLVNIV